MSTSIGCRGRSEARAAITEQPVPTFTIAQLRTLANQALRNAGASAPMADSTARALVDAEAEGLSSHGLSRIAQYVMHLRNGRADGNARAVISKAKGGAVLIDAGSGLAFPACAWAVAEAIARARQFGVAFAGVTNSHHFGVAAYHLGPIAKAAMVGIAAGNSPAAMPAARGKGALVGNNHIPAH